MGKRNFHVLNSMWLRLQAALDSSILSRPGAEGMVYTALVVARGRSRDPQCTDGYGHLLYGGLDPASESASGAAKNHFLFFRKYIPDHLQNNM